MLAREVRDEGLHPVGWIEAFEQQAQVTDRDAALGRFRLLMIQPQKARHMHALTQGL